MQHAVEFLYKNNSTKVLSIEKTRRQFVVLVKSRRADTPADRLKAEVWKALLMDPQEVKVQT